jgi:hypothetical protein
VVIAKVRLNLRYRDDPVERLRITVHSNLYAFIWPHRFDDGGEMRNNIIIL